MLSKSLFFRFNILTICTACALLLFSDAAVLDKSYISECVLCGGGGGGGEGLQSGALMDSDSVLVEGP